MACTFHIKKVNEGTSEKGQNEKVKRKVADFQRLEISFCDPFGIQNPKYREIILKWFAL